mmetsp:Transcript_70099/g.111502  ORF Transcript_70099/g.111502 Transcript_70099/m.111502 type:complete len:711 (+) Transcript_70099:50-2182(+)
MADTDDTTPRWILFGLATSLLVIGFLPFSLYYAWRIYHHKNSIIIHKRLPYLIVVTVIGNCLYLSTEKTLKLFLTVQANQQKDHTLLDTRARIVNAAVHWIFIYALYLTVLRFWLLYFKLEWALSNINNQWLAIINSRYQEQDWFLKNKKTYGSYTWLIKKVMLSTTLLVLLYESKAITLCVIQPDKMQYTLIIDFVVGAVVYSPALCIMLYILFKLPAFDDYLSIHDEAKFSTIVFIALTVLNLIAAVLDEELHDLGWIGTGLQFTIFLVSVVGFFALNYKQTRWVLLKFSTVLRRFSSRQIKKIAFGENNDDDEMSNYHELDGGAEATHTGSKRQLIQLRHVFNHDRAFDLFMNYLYKNHCAEVLLSLTEMTQFQQLIHDELWGALDVDLEDEMDDQEYEDIQKSNTLNANAARHSVSNSAIKKVSLSIKRLSKGPFKNHNRNGKVKPFEIQIQNSPPNQAANPNSMSNSNSVAKQLQASAAPVSPPTMEWNALIADSLQKLNGSEKSLLDVDDEKDTELMSSLQVADTQIARMGNAMVQLPPTLPRSSIVYHRFRTDDLTEEMNGNQSENGNENGNGNVNITMAKLRKYRCIAYDIYEKYIRIGSEYEINIDFNNRKRYNRILANKTAWLNHDNHQFAANENADGSNMSMIYNAQFLQEAMILFELYQPCIDQMYRFCSSCFSTFKTTDDFDHLTELFKIKNITEQL